MKKKQKIVLAVDKNTIQFLQFLHGKELWTPWDEGERDFVSGFNLAFIVCCATLQLYI